MGADRRRKLLDGFIADIAELPLAGGTLLVHVSPD